MENINFFPAVVSCNNKVTITCEWQKWADFLEVFLFRHKNMLEKCSVLLIAKNNIRKFFSADNNTVTYFAKLHESATPVHIIWFHH